VLTLNYLRTLVAHRYRSTGGEMSFSEQLDDSINIEGYPLITEVVFPIGLRYHALHHLFPSIPYHNLGTAHRRLMAQLPEDSPYRRTVFRNTFTAIKSLWTDFRAVRRAATNA
jgi:fatty acid desaturase